MSCCMITKDTSSSVDELNKLGNHFDEVVLEKKEKYQLLTMRDKTLKSNYDYVVWLQIKVSYGKGEKHNFHSDEDMLVSVCKEVLEWIEALKNFDKSNNGKQLSLFGEEEEEQEPPAPTHGEDRQWSSYMKKCEGIRKRRLLKKYNFFELAKYHYYSYSGIDHRVKLPSVVEVKELLKKAITEGMVNPGRYEEFWFDTPSYLTRDGGLSDCELKKRLGVIRLFLVPYWDYSCVSPDMSYYDHKRNPQQRYRYYLDRTSLSICSAHDNDKLDLPSYDGVYDLELLEWVRETMNIPHVDTVSDEEVLGDNIKSYFRRLIGHDAYDSYNFEKKVNTFKNYKQLKASLSALVPDGDNGGGSGYSIDGYSGSISIDRKGHIEVTQELNDRLKQNKSMEGLKENRFGEIVVFDLKGDEIFKKAFELFNKKAPRQESLFDFLAA